MARSLVEARRPEVGSYPFRIPGLPPMPDSRVSHPFNILFVPEAFRSGLPHTEHVFYARSTDDPDVRAAVITHITTHSTEFVSIETNDDFGRVHVHIPRNLDQEVAIYNGHSQYPLSESPQQQELLLLVHNIKCELDANIEHRIFWQEDVLAHQVQEFPGGRLGRRETDLTRQEAEALQSIWRILEARFPTPSVE